MRKRSGLSAAVRMRVMKRDKFQCTYCGVAGTEAELEVDHIIALANGGSHHMSNLTTACRACNQKKSDGAPLARLGNGLVGMFLHTFKDGQIECQGEIIATDGDTVLVQWFDWVVGAPLFVEPIAKSEIYSKCKLYSCAQLMNQAYAAQERLLRRYGHLSGGAQAADSDI